MAPEILVDKYYRHQAESLKKARPEIIVKTTN